MNEHAASPARKRRAQVALLAEKLSDEVADVAPLHTATQNDATWRVPRAVAFLHTCLVKHESARKQNATLAATVLLL